VEAEGRRLEWVRRITNQIPDARMHLVRYYRAYANRSRMLYRDEEGEVEVMPSGAESPGGGGRVSRASWARLLKRVFDIDLACPRCGAQMRVVSFLTDPEVVDRVLAHVREEEVELLFDPRAPPAA
jgi:hypothetical protein